MARLTRSERTSAKVASAAEKVFKDPKASMGARNVAATALTQKSDKKSSARRKRRDPK